MMGFFSRRKQAADTGGLGTTVIALRLDAGDVAPAGSTQVIFNAAGQARRAAAGKVTCGDGETVFCFHPGPYTVELVPFAAAPEWGLQMRFVVDAANPRVSQQRFDLYLFSETAGRLALDDFRAGAEMALQAELAQGALELPPCTTLEEWHTFRAGLNQLMYTRYGVTVDDCVPVDLGEQIDYASILQARAEYAADVDADAISPPAVHASEAPISPAATASTPSGSAATAPIPAAATATAPSGGAAAAPHPSEVTAAAALAPHVVIPDAVRSAHAFDEPPISAPRAPTDTPASTRVRPESGTAAQQDARALRRLFLELPALSAQLRVLALPDGLPTFQQHQALLLRLGMAALNVNTMPALAWAAPDQPLPAADQQRRNTHTQIAQTALDEAWSLLARLQLATPDQWPPLLDEADRICANLETGLALRRQPHAERREPSL